MSDSLLNRIGPDRIDWPQSCQYAGSRLRRMHDRSYLCHAADTARLGGIPPRMTRPRATAGVRAVCVTPRIRVEGRRLDELAAEPAGRCRPRGHNSAHFDWNRRADCRCAAGQPATRRSATDGNARSHCYTALNADGDTVAPDANAATRAADS